MGQIPSIDELSAGLQPLGRLKTCFGEKFGAPRQPGLVPSAWGRLRLPLNEEHREAIHGLDTFSHLWLIFVFDGVCGRPWSPRVRPPRLGGDRSVGVFASRSPFRPNPLGLSAVKYEGSREEGRELVLEFSGVDLVSGTPILDIKPYVPYTDAIEAAEAGWSAEPWPELKVEFSEEALLDSRSVHDEGQHAQWRLLVEEVLSADPRPAYQRQEQGRVYGMSLSGANLRYEVREGCCWVLSWKALDQGVP